MANAPISIARGKLLPRRACGIAPWRAACWLLLACCSFAALAQADIDAATAERRIKAAFIYKFAGYIEWPAKSFVSADAPIVIGVEGDESLADELARIVVGRKAADRHVEVRKLARGAAAAGLHAVYVADPRDDRIAAIAPPSAPTLVITAAPGAFPAGSTINFVVVDEHMRFEASVDDAERRGLKLSSRLLAVAQNVINETP